MNTEANAGTGQTTPNATPRKGPRIFARTAILAVGLLAAAGGIYYLALTLRGIILDMAAADRGEWASLMGGGLGVWAFFLVRTGIIERAFDLVPRLRAVLESLPAPQWPTFLGNTLELSKTLMMPALVTVFALVFVGEHVAEQVTEPVDDPPTSPVSRQIYALRAALDSRLDNIESNLGDTPFRAALNAQGYTPDRARRLDRIGTEAADRSDYYFARFPIAFDAGILSDDGTTFVRGAAYDPEANRDLVARLVNALVQCGTADDPVRLRVEGYASSEPFLNTTGDVTSDDLNLRLANERRRSVKEALDAAMVAAGSEDALRRFLVTEADDYRTIDEMEADREFNDRPAGDNPSRLPQDFLTRAAHVKVMSPGTCRVRPD